MTKPITPPGRYLQSIGSLHRVSSDGAEDLNDLPERVTAHGESVDILQSCALHPEPVPLCQPQHGSMSLHEKITSELGLARGEDAL